jgi:hypothetical protein
MNELYHHGILGQKWGIRRYQNEDGSLTPEGKKRYGYGVDYDKGYTIKKGTTISRTSFINNEKEQGRTYASFLDKDVETYQKRGKALADFANQKAYRYDFKAKEDLKMPSRKEMVDIYLDMLRSEKPNSKLLKKGEAFKEKAFDKFQYSLVKQNDKSQKYFDMIRDKGYNAMLDTADMRQKLSELPIIVIDRGKSLTLQAIKEID